MRWARNGAKWKSQGRCRNGLLKDKAPRHRLGLPRRPRAELAQAWTGGKILVGLRAIDRFGLTVDPHLSLEFRPMKTQGGMRVGAEFHTLGAREVRVENEPACIGLFQQYDAHRRPSRGIDRGQGHGGRIRGLGDARRRKPLEESCDRIDFGHPETVADPAPSRCPWLGQRHAGFARGI